MTEKNKKKKNKQVTRKTNHKTTYQTNTQTKNKIAKKHQKKQKIKQIAKKKTQRKKAIPHHFYSNKTHFGWQKKQPTKMSTHTNHTLKKHTKKTKKN